MTAKALVGSTRRLAWLPLALTSALLVSGCGASDEQPTATRAITHAYGTTTLDDNPERVVVIGSSAQDAVAALGVLPVAVPSEYGTADGYTPWFLDYVNTHFDGALPATVGSSGPDLAPEVILNYEPDLILAPYSGMTEIEYERLSAIAPTVPFAETPWTYGGWADMTMTVGQALGREQQARELVNTTAASIAAQASAHPALADQSFIFGEWVAESTAELAVYSPKDPRPTFMREFGLVDDPSVSQVVTDFGADYYGAVSLERIGELSADVFIGWANSPEGITHTLENTLVAGWQPIATGHYYYIEEPGMLIAITVPTVLSAPWAIENGLLDDLDSAVAGNPVVRTSG